MKNRVVILVLLTFVVFAGCREDVQMVLDLSDSHGFYDRGFPSDLSLSDDGSPDLAGFPQALNATIGSYKAVVKRDIKGFSPVMPIYMSFKGDIATEDIRINDDPLDYISNSASVQLLDVDPDSGERGQRFAIKVSLQEDRDEYRPEGLLQVLPVGRFLKENTTYALIVTRAIAKEDGDKLIPNPVLNALLKGLDPRGADNQISADVATKALEVYAPLKNQLAADAISADEIIGAVVWATGEPSKKLGDLVKRISQWPTPEIIRPFELKEERDDYYILESAWIVPGLQEGSFPYAFPINGGSILYDDNGDPIVQYHRETPIIITIPKGPVRDDGYPVIFYNHGTAGYATQVFERGVKLPDGTATDLGNVAHLAAKQGWAATGMGGHMGADHEDQKVIMNAFLDLIPGVTLNIVSYNFLNPQAMRDNFFQMVAERVLFRKLVNTLEIDPSVCPGLDNDMPISFNTDTQVVFGQSLGSMTAIAQAANDPDGYQGLSGTGAGSFGLGLVMHLSTIGEKPLGNILEPLFFFTGENDIVKDPFHPVYALSDLALGQANIAIQASRWTRSDDPEIPAPHILIVEGFFDDWVTVQMQQPLLRALGVDLAGPELDVPEDKKLQTWLEYAGKTQLDYPVSGNLNGRTAAVVRYPEDGILSGHHVFFQYEAPKRQLAQFLDDINNGLVPDIIE